MKKVTWISIVGDKSNYEVSNNLATLTVKEGSLTKSKLTLILKNNSDHGC